MDLQGWSSLILSLVGVGGLVTSYGLSKRGQHVQQQQTYAANRLSERVQAFDELEKLNNNLRAEIERLRKVAAEVEEAGERRLAAQALRCRNRLEDLVAVVTGLRGVVLSEIAQASADESAEVAQQHLQTDHPKP